MTSPSKVEQRAARVALVDGGVGLDEVLVARIDVAQLLADDAVLGADDPHRHGLARGRAGCRSPARSRRPAPGPNRPASPACRSAGGLSSLTTATSVAGSLPSTRAAKLAVVGQPDHHLVGARDHVVVGQHDARLVDDEARAQRLLLLARARAGPAMPNCSRSIRLHGILDREAPDELRALDGDDRALDPVDQRRDRARLGARVTPPGRRRGARRGAATQAGASAVADERAPRRPG